jgi:hypothetical protein
VGFHQIAEDAAGRDQQIVAGLVAEVVVDVLEVIDVRVQHDLGAIRRPFRSKTIAAQRHLLVYLLRQRFPKGMDRVASFWEIAAVTGYPNASSVQWAYRAESRRRGEATRDEARN